MSDNVNKDIQDAINKGCTVGNNDSMDKIDFPDPKVLQHGLDMDRMSTPEKKTNKSSDKR